MIVYIFIYEYQYATYIYLINISRNGNNRYIPFSPGQCGSRMRAALRRLAPPTAPNRAHCCTFEEGVADLGVAHLCAHFPLLVGPLPPPIPPPPCLEALSVILALAATPLLLEPLLLPAASPSREPPPWESSAAEWEPLVLLLLPRLSVRVVNVLP